MHRKHTSIDQLASQTMRQAQTESAMMQREIGKLRTGISSSGHRASLPRIAKKRSWSKATTNESLANDLLGLLLIALANEGAFGKNTSTNASFSYGGTSFGFSSSSTEKSDEQIEAEMEERRTGKASDSQKSETIWRTVITSHVRLG